MHHSCSSPILLQQVQDAGGRKSLWAFRGRKGGSWNVIVPAKLTTIVTHRVLIQSVSNALRKERVKGNRKANCTVHQLNSVPAPCKNVPNLAWNDSSCLVFSLLIGRKVSPGLVHWGSAKKATASPQPPRSEEETPSHRDMPGFEDRECNAYSNSWFSRCN